MLTMLFQVVPLGPHPRLLNLVGTWASQTVCGGSAVTYSSALLAKVSALCSVCAALLTVSTPTLLRLPCGQYTV